jgi:hypothetical protein
VLSRTTNGRREQKESKRRALFLRNETKKNKEPLFFSHTYIFINTGPRTKKLAHLQRTKLEDAEGLLDVDWLLA